MASVTSAGREKGLKSSGGGFSEGWVPGAACALARHGRGALCRGSLALCPPCWLPSSTQVLCSVTVTLGSWGAGPWGLGRRRVLGPREDCFLGVPSGHEEQQ